MRRGLIPKAAGERGCPAFRSGQTARLLRTEWLQAHAWIGFALRGTRSNRSAIGARVTVTRGDHRQIREVMSGSSYYSQSDLRLHFGLGSAARADTVEVAWPSGLKEALRELPADHLFVIQETKGIVDRRRLG